MASVQLRSYQDNAVTQVAVALNNQKKPILQFMTGAGKTLTTCALLYQKKLKTLVVVPNRSLAKQWRKELIKTGFQPYDIAFYFSNGGPDQRTPKAQITICATYKNFANRVLPKQANYPKQLWSDFYDLLVLDEAHNAMAPRVLKAIESEFKVNKILGLTATPWHRFTPLSRIFDQLIVGPEYSKLVELDSLSPHTYLASKESLLSYEDCKNIKSEKLLNQRLTETVETDTLSSSVLGEWENRAYGASTIVFAASVEHSQLLAASFNQNKFSAAHVDQDTSDSERERIYSEFRIGNIQVICNYGILKEGLDLPECECVILARATSSPVVFFQAIGRSLRYLPEKTSTIIDLAENYKRFGTPHWPTKFNLDGTLVRPHTRLKRGADGQVKEVEVPSEGCVELEVLSPENPQEWLDIWPYVFHAWRCKRLPKYRLLDRLRELSKILGPWPDSIAVQLGQAIGNYERNVRRIETSDYRGLMLTPRQQIGFINWARRESGVLYLLENLKFVAAPWRLPDKPGVYFLMDALKQPGEIGFLAYVGESDNLFNRWWDNGQKGTHKVYKKLSDLKLSIFDVDYHKSSLCIGFLTTPDYSKLRRAALERQFIQTLHPLLNTQSSLLEPFRHAIEQVELQKSLNNRIIISTYHIRHIAKCYIKRGADNLKIRELPVKELLQMSKNDIRIWIERNSFR